MSAHVGACQTPPLGFWPRGWASCLGFPRLPWFGHLWVHRPRSGQPRDRAASYDETTGVEVSEQEGEGGSRAGNGGAPELRVDSARLAGRSDSDIRPPLSSPGTGVTVNALHPGVARTELGRHTGMHSSAFSSFTLGEPPPGPGRPRRTPALPARGQEPPAGHEDQWGVR